MAAVSVDPSVSVVSAAPLWLLGVKHTLLLYYAGSHRLVTHLREWSLTGTWPTQAVHVMQKKEK